MTNRLMKHQIFTFGLFLLATTAVAQPAALEGFTYEEYPTAPTGQEWQSPEALALNKEQPRAWGFHFPTEEASRQVLPESGAYWQSLDGTWKFHWCKEPGENRRVCKHRHRKRNNRPAPHYVCILSYLVVSASVSGKC